jgi:hypothetical protein
MGDRFGFRLAIGLALVAALAGVGFYTYNLGLAHGVAQGSQAIAAPGAGGVPVVIWLPLMILFWIFVLRGLFWRGAWRGRGCRHDTRPYDRSAGERTT